MRPSQLEELVMERRQQNGDDAYAGSYRYARARSPGRKQFAQQHAPPEYSPSGLHEGAEKDAWAPDKKTRFETMSRVSFRADDPKRRGSVSQRSPHERWHDREQLSGDIRPGLTHILRRLEDDAEIGSLLSKLRGDYANVKAAVAETQINQIKCARDTRETTERCKLMQAELDRLISNDHIQPRGPAYPISRRFISNDTSLIDVVHQLRTEQESLQASFRASIAELEAQCEAKFDEHEEHMAKPTSHFEVWARQQVQRFNEFEAAAHEESRALSSKLGAEQEKRHQLEIRLARLESRLLEREQWIGSPSQWQAEHVQARELRERVSIALPPDTRSDAFPRRDASATREIHRRDRGEIDVRDRGEIDGRDRGEIDVRETHSVDMRGDYSPPVSPREHSSSQQHATDKIRHMGSRASPSERFTTPDLRSARLIGSGQSPRTGTAASTAAHAAEDARAAKAAEVGPQSWVLKAQANVDEAEAEARASLAFNRIVQQAISRVETEAQAIKAEAEAEKRASRTDTEVRAAQAEADRRYWIRKASNLASHTHTEASTLALEESGDLSDAKVLTWELGDHRALWGVGACGKLGDATHSLPSPWPTTSSSRSFPGGGFEVGLATANSKDELGGGDGGGRPVQDPGDDWPSGTLVPPQGKDHAAQQTPHMAVMAGETASKTPGTGDASVGSPAARQSSSVSSVSVSVSSVSSVPAALQSPRTGTEHLNIENLRQVIMDNGERLRTLFEMWDEDASGSISAKEFRSALKTLGFRASDAHMNALFDKLDKDKSGQLDYKEMLKAIEGSRKSDKAKIALERKLLEEKRAREAAEARAAALSAQFAAARA